EQQSLMARVELGRAQLRMTLEIKSASLHKAQRFRDALGQFDIAPRLRTVLDETQHPLPHAREIGVAALGKRAQQIERRGRLAICLDLPAWIGTARVFAEVD